MSFIFWLFNFYSEEIIEPLDFRQIVSIFLLNRKYLIAVRGQDVIKSIDLIFESLNISFVSDYLLSKEAHLANWCLLSSNDFFV